MNLVKGLVLFYVILLIVYLRERILNAQRDDSWCLEVKAMFCGKHDWKPNIEGYYFDDDG